MALQNRAIFATKIKMQTQTKPSQAKPYKGMAMEGIIAKWYAGNTPNS